MKLARCAVHVMQQQTAFSPAMLRAIEQSLRSLAVQQLVQPVYAAAAAATASPTSADSIDFLVAKI